MKRLFDITAAFAALLLLALPLALLTWQVRRKLGSPAFFRQVRPGMHGQPFEMVKFRTMTDARGPDGALLPDADRLTPFGRFLRASSLDELPELWNVLKGEMSLVGPRPLRAWAEELLDENKLRQQGFLNPAPIRQKWAEHLSGQRNWQHHLWDVLMFQAWLREQE